MTTPVSHHVKLVCGTHKNSFVITLGFQYDEMVEHPTACEALVTSRNVRRCQRPAKFRVWESRIARGGID